MSWSREEEFFVGVYIDRNPWQIPPSSGCQLLWRKQAAVVRVIVGDLWTQPSWALKSQRVSEDFLDNSQDFSSLAGFRWRPKSEPNQVQIRGCPAALKELLWLDWFIVVRVVQGCSVSGSGHVYRDDSPLFSSSCTLLRIPHFCFEWKQLIS